MKEYVILWQDSTSCFSMSKPILGILVQDQSGTRITGIDQFDTIATIPSNCLVIESQFMPEYIAK